jgi:hypothetical protein
VVHAHPGARSEELFRQKTVSTPPITLRRYVYVKGRKPSAYSLRPRAPSHVGMSIS